MKVETHADRREHRKDVYANAKDQFCQMIVDYVAAPYEADTQLDWMMKDGVVDDMFTRDSVHFVHVASIVTFKITKDGSGDFIQSQSITSLDSSSFYNFTGHIFVFMCICARCNFFTCLNGLVFCKANSIGRRRRMSSHLTYSACAISKLSIPQTFIVHFIRTCLFSYYKTIYNKTVWGSFFAELAKHTATTLPDIVVTKL